jgi:hypothetical protein
LQDAESLHLQQQYLLTLHHSGTAVLPAGSSCTLRQLTLQPPPPMLAPPPPPNAPDGTPSRKLLGEVTNVSRSRSLLQGAPAAAPASSQSDGVSAMPAQEAQEQLLWGPLVFTAPGAMTLALELPARESAELRTFEVLVTAVRFTLPRPCTLLKTSCSSGLPPELTICCYRCKLQLTRDLASGNPHVEAV